MSSSRGEGPFSRGIRAGVVGAGALILVAAHAFAADPVPPEAPAAESVPPAEAPSAPPPNLRRVISRPGANDMPIDMGALGAPDTSRVGLIGIATGGLSPGMWDGTRATKAAELLAGDPRPTRSLALQGLARRLLLSEARPPEGPLPSGESFLTLRLKRLLALGDFDSVQQLSNPVMPAPQTDGEERVRAEAFLLGGDEASACALTQRMRRVVSDPYWAKLGAFCDVRDGNVPAAELAVGLLKSQGYEDAQFYALYDWLVIPPGEEKPSKDKKKKAAKPRIPPKGDGTPLAFAMLRAAKLPIGEGSLAAGRPATLHAVALEAAGAPQEERLAAATEAASYGAFPLDQLRALFGEVNPSAEALANPAGIGVGLPAGQALTLLYRSVESARIPAERLHRARAGYQAALARDHGALFASLIQPSLRRLTPDAALIAEVPGLVEILLAAHDADFAYAWFGLIDERQDDRDADPRARDHLSNLLRIARPSERLVWSDKIIRRQLDRAALQGSAALAERSFEIRLLQALGYAVPADVNAAMPPVPPVLGTALPAFQDAVAGGRIAEAVLGVFRVLGSEGPGAAPPGAVIELVRGLTAIGLEDEARAIALEAAMASRAARS